MELPDSPVTMIPPTPLQVTGKPPARPKLVIVLVVLMFLHSALCIYVCTESFFFFTHIKTWDAPLRLGLFVSLFEFLMSNLRIFLAIWLLRRSNLIRVITIVFYTVEAITMSISTLSLDYIDFQHSSFQSSDIILTVLPLLLLSIPILILTRPKIVAVFRKDR